MMVPNSVFWDYAHTHQGDTLHFALLLDPHWGTLLAAWSLAMSRFRNFGGTGYPRRPKNYPRHRATERNEPRDRLRHAE